MSGTMRVTGPTIHGLPRVTDEELEALGNLNPGWKFERDDDGRTLVSPTNTEGGAKSAEAVRQLAAWRDSTNVGGKVYDSSTGFTMSTTAVRSPDASWLSQQRIDVLPSHVRTGFWRVCPDVVIEVLSEWDPWTAAIEKIDMYRREGAQYVVAIDPYGRRVDERGEPPPGLELDFDAIMDA